MTKTDQKKLDKVIILLHELGISLDTNLEGQISNGSEPGEWIANTAWEHSSIIIARDLLEKLL
jgi:hypothetical protein